MQAIKDIVSGLLENYGTLNTFELCDCLGIKILRSNIGNEIKGFFQRTPNGYEVIHINSEVCEHEIKYICAHELGHAILHTSISLSFFIENCMQVKDKYEIQADKFAAELLIDHEINDAVYSELNIEQLSSTFCVPSKLIKYKFNLSL
ncbi:MAG: Zn-dependent peptidase ImmA (M78 family) [Clostridium sp.]|jgi:Zn-dependent peptidase ImmA (M78 family)